MTRNEKTQALEMAVSSIEKTFGRGTIICLGKNRPEPAEVFSTGSMTIDWQVIGAGGIPRSRITELYGAECLDGNTFVQYEVRHLNGKRSNVKGGPLKRLYERFHKIPPAGDGRGKYQRPITENACFFAPSINEEGRIFHNRIVNVVSSGKKKCFHLKTRMGCEIVASADHRFWNGESWVPLSAIKRGDTVYIHNLRFVAIPDQVVDKNFVGLRDTYDLQMADPHNNFIANRFVVHNSGGKTTLALQTIALAQQVGERAAFIDAEHGLDLTYAKALGVNTNELLVNQPDYGEQALQVAETLIQSGAVGIIVVDSVGGLLPKAELEGEIGDAGVGLLARLMAQALRKLMSEVRKSRTALVFINQLRDKIGAMAFGEQTNTPGGRALKHLSSLRLDVRRISQLKLGEKIVGSRVKIRCPKNRIGSPYQEGEVDLIFGKGFSREADLLDFATPLGVLEKEGTWYTFGGERLGQGREQARALLAGNPEWFNKIRTLAIEEHLKRRESVAEPE